MTFTVDRNGKHYLSLVSDYLLFCVYIGCLPFVRIIRLGRALINGKGFSKISKPTERNGAYHLQFDFPSLFSADERLETGKFCKW